MIYFLRHGLDDERFIGGWSNGELIWRGREQVKEAVSFLKEHPIHFDRIYTSDLSRALETAQMVQKEFEVPIIKDERLRELNKGDLNGMYIVEANLKHNYREFLQNMTIDTTYPNGESLRIFWERMADSLPYFLEQDDALIVTHRGVINYLYYQMNNMFADGRAINMDKGQFNVTHASIHEYDPKTKQIQKIY
ncbi:MAG: phosphoglycerate mutase family protein [Bacilli bacterium]|nr:phosphoglycerate mutase family protein [Bacilli bacterium]